MSVQTKVVLVLPVSHGILHKSLLWPAASPWENRSWKSGRGCLRKDNQSLAFWIKAYNIVAIDLYPVSNCLLQQGWSVDLYSIFCWFLWFLHHLALFFAWMLTSSVCVRRWIQASCLVTSTFQLKKKIRFARNDLTYILTLDVIFKTPKIQGFFFWILFTFKLKLG